MNTRVVGDRLSDAELFVAVVAAGGFSGGARRLGRTQPAVSRRIATLEARLGVRLIDRTTRRFSLTDAGRAFNERCREALSSLADAEAAAIDTGGAVRGMLRVSAPPAWARAQLAPLLPALAARHPQLTIDLLLVERYVDLVEEGFDAVIRLGPLPDSSLAGRQFSRGRYVLCGAPSHLARHGAPDDLEEVARQPALVLATSGSRARWPFRWRGRSSVVNPKAVLLTNDAALLREAALAGAGLTVLPCYLVDADLAAGDLVEVLPGARLPSWEAHILHAGRRHVAGKIRAFIDFLCARAGRSTP